MMVMLTDPRQDHVKIGREWGIPLSWPRGHSREPELNMMLIICTVDNVTRYMVRPTGARAPRVRSG